ncbi:MAG: SMP-30/gluconolactonase/LRE family protein [Pyrinomonadaceae bacterium]|nr:SMP-30/gluconolactonase/LRE family protein [Pyrinomonadaceae bacterium]
MKQKSSALTRLTCLVAALCGLFAVTSCKKAPDGLVLMTDPSYTATVFASNKIGFGAPDGILWNRGKLYLADEGRGALAVWSTNDGMRELVDAQFGIDTPEDLVIDAEGNIFFSDDAAGGVWEVDSAGKQHLLAGKDKGLYSTEGIALAPDGSILVGDADQHQIFRVTKAGEVSVFLGREFGITKPESMTFDDKGNLYIADNEDNVLYLLDKNHQLHRVVDRRDYFSPETIFFANGSLYITDSNAGKLYIYTPNEELKPIATFSGQLGNIQGVTVDEHGEIYVSVQSDLKKNIGYIIKIGKEEPLPVAIRN